MSRLQLSRRNAISSILFTLLLSLLQFAEANKTSSRLRNCGSRYDTCSARQPSSTGSKAIGCLCDADCFEYGDCCFDTALSNSTSPSHRWSCESINLNTSVYVVSACQGVETALHHLCGSPSHDYSLDVPVLSQSTGTFYKNIYCALCNGQNVSDLEKVRLEIVCNKNVSNIKQFIEEAQYHPGERLWTKGAISCHFTADYPRPQPTGRNTRLCWPSVDRCPDHDHGASGDFSILCSKYQQPVYDTRKEMNYTLFKNPHCAACHGVSTSHIACKITSSSILKTSTKVVVLPSLSMVIEINFKAETCTFPLIWDGLLDKCRLLLGSDAYSSSLTSRNATLSNGSTTALSDFVVSRDRIFQGYLSSACVMLSLICLLFNILVHHFWKKKPVSLPSKTLNSLSWSLFLSLALFQFGVVPTFAVSHKICYAIAVTVNFLFLLSFFWMNVMSFDIWRTFSSEGYLNDTYRNHTFYWVYAGGGALIIVTIAVVSDAGTWLPAFMRPQYALLPNVCWFSSRLGALVFLHAPALILITVNSVFFAITISWFQKQSDAAKILKEQTPGRKDYVRFWLYLKLSTIMGVSWLSGAVASVTGIEEFWYPFILLIGLQGVLIFFTFNPQIFPRKITSLCSFFSSSKIESFSKTVSAFTSKTSKSGAASSISK